jgi:O-methyltransferase involved in polyketide biosynthesis
MTTDTSRISPTAHYTGYVWCKNGLSPPELMTPEGRAMFYGLMGPMLLASLGVGGLTLENMLLQRHRMIDHLLEQAITDGHVGQVIEVAAGISGRGWRFCRRHPELIYIEGDLPDMAERKRRMLAPLQRDGARHHVVTLNALLDGGSDSLHGNARDLLDEQRGVAIITEGLLPYFPVPAVRGMWRRFAELLRGYPSALYLSDIHLQDEVLQRTTVRLFRAGLQLITRGSNHLMDDAPSIEQAWRDHGLEHIRLHSARTFPRVAGLPRANGPQVVRVLEARR